MEAMPRHQCVIYDGSPAKMLPAIAVHIKERLNDNLRCLYLNSPAMVAGMRSYLFAAGVDVTLEVARGSLVLSSDQSHSINGQFEVDRMLQMLEETLSQALTDGYQGLWATGDMTWELGRDNNLEKLLQYEWGLEQMFQKYPRLSGICQYHAGTLPQDVVCHSLLTHPALFINETLTRVNPRFIPSVSPIRPVDQMAELKHTVQNLCALQRGEDMEK